MAFDEETVKDQALRVLKAKGILGGHPIHRKCTSALAAALEEIKRLTNEGQETWMAKDAEIAFEKDRAEQAEAELERLRADLKYERSQNTQLEHKYEVAEAEVERLRTEVHQRTHVAAERCDELEARAEQAEAELERLKELLAEVNRVNDRRVEEAEAELKRCRQVLGALVRHDRAADERAGLPGCIELQEAEDSL